MRYSIEIGLCWCKKIAVKNKTREVKSGKITFELDPDFEVPITTVKIDGFLTTHCSLWKKMDEKKEESPEYFLKNPAQISLESFECLDIVF